MINLFGDRVRTQGRNILGCDACPMAGVPGIRRITGLSRIHKRKVMLWAQSPGRQENTKGLELVGPAGTLLWESLQPLGLGRDDFDIQNVMRCWPLDSSGTEHKPTKRELQCCSVHTEEALERNGGCAKVHLILGEVAGRQLLNDAYRKDRPVFWHEPWGAQVVLAAHPSFVLRMGGKKAGFFYDEFLDRMRAVKILLQHPGKQGFLQAQDYGAVTTREEMDSLVDRIQKEAHEGRRVSVDIEDGTIDGSKRVLLIGFGWGQFTKPNDYSSWSGGARSVVTHPDSKYLMKKTTQVLEDPNIRKVLQHGSYDQGTLRDVLGIRLKGYDFDPQYGAYLHNSNLRTYGLEVLSSRMFPEFGNWKDMVSKWSGHFEDVPLKTLVRYNCADCDVTKRLESRIAPQVSIPLVKVYIHDAIVLDKMQKTGPLLDYKTHEKVYAVVDKKLKATRSSLCKLAGKPDFNPNTPAEVAWLLFDKLGLPELEGRSTKNDVLEALFHQTKHPVLKLQIKHRELQTMKGTFLDGYKRSADKNDGELRTIWWLTGAATGRLRSGKGERSEAEGICNFQNLHANPLLMNLLVSDKNWREALNEA